MADALYAKFLPEGIPGWQRPFWESLRAHDVRVQQCSQCGTHRYHPKEICSHCRSRRADWAPIRGTGEVYTYTIVRRAPTAAYEPDVPYVIAHVAMDEGFRMVARLTGIDLSEVGIGLPVRLGYEDVTPDWSIFTFASKAGDPHPGGRP